MTLSQETSALLSGLGVDCGCLSGGDLVVTSPVTGEAIAQVAQVSGAEAGRAIGQAHAAFVKWRMTPAPRRGELVRLLGE
ncbi:aldehyde dehydrogenase family protein, partial [Aquamicrobium ahrensii]